MAVLHLAKKRIAGVMVTLLTWSVVNYCFETLSGQTKDIETLSGQTKDIETLSGQTKDVETLSGQTKDITLVFATFLLSMQY